MSYMELSRMTCPLLSMLSSDEVNIPGLFCADVFLKFWTVMVASRKSLQWQSLNLEPKVSMALPWSFGILPHSYLVHGITQFIISFLSSPRPPPSRIPSWAYLCPSPNALHTTTIWSLGRWPILSKLRSFAKGNLAMWEKRKNKLNKVSAPEVGKTSLSPTELLT